MPEPDATWPRRGVLDRLARKIKDHRVLDLVGTILAGANPPEEPPFYYPGDDLFTPHQRPRGLPLGNQTSQFFANVFLDPFDHFVKEVLRRRAYIRYVDDFVILGQSSAELVEIRERCREFLNGLRLTMHPRKCVISRVADGIRFLGLQVWPDHCRLPRPWRVRVRRRIRAMAASYQSRKIGWQTVVQRVAAWRGHAFWPGAQRWLFQALRGEGFNLRLLSRVFQ